jgi:hypothetical protein
MRSSGLKMGRGGGSALISSLCVLAGLDFSILDLSMSGPLWIGLLSPPDMQARTLSSSGVAGRNKKWYMMTSDSDDRTL